MSQSAAAKSTQSGSESRGNRYCTIIKLEKSDGPDNAAGNDWYRYEIDSPGSPIIGYCRGNKTEVTRRLNETISKIEERLSARKARKR